MKILLVVLCLLALSAQGQREAYVQHSLLMDSAEYLSFRGKYEEAVPLYEKVLTRSPPPGPYFDAVQACLLTGRPQKANDFLYIAVQRGFVPEVFRWDTLLMGHLANDASKDFRDRRKEAERMFASNADSVLIKELSAMCQRDQEVRTSASPGTAMHPVDSTNFERLIELCQERGYPRSEEIGNGMGDVWLLLWHHRSLEYPGSDQWKRILPYIQKAIAAGDLSPSFLCMFDDFADQEAGRPMRYGALLGYYQSMPDLLYFVDRTTLDHARASVGWGPISRFAEELEMDLSTVRFAAP